jgi:hypothetical protein
MKRTLAEWASVAEIIGALAIVVSLVFVGLQIRANTRATQNATYQQSVGYEIDILLSLASSSPEARDQYRARMGRGAAESDAPGQNLFVASIRLWEDMYLQHEAGSLADWAWKSREPVITSFALGPGAAQMLENDSLTEGFAKYVRSVREEAGLTSPRVQ